MNKDNPLKRKQSSQRERKRIKQDIPVQDLDLVLPRALNVTEAINARKFEVLAMEKAIRDASQFTGQLRVFQTVKRHMRRRAASLNVKRLPKYVRNRALAQMAKDPLPPPSTTRKSKRKPKRLLSEVLSRPGAKKWLETHLWHAKRMKMVEKWGIKLSLNANQKGLRFAYRAAKHECIMHDASYERMIQLRGPESEIVQLMDAFSDPSLPSVGSKQFLSGSKQGVMFLHKPYQFPIGGMCPVNFLWKPVSDPQSREFWLFVHPGMFNLVYNSILQQLGTDTIDLDTPVLVDIPNKTIGNLDISCPSSNMIQFEFFGPRAHAILGNCLVLADSDSANVEAHNVWNQLKVLSSASSLPSGVVLSLTIEDPRICFPMLMPKRITSNANLPDSYDSVVSILKKWPENLSKSSIWNKSACEEALATRPTNLEIKNRRSENLVPGAKLTPLPTDPKIPILLIRRNTTLNSNQRECSEAMCGWSLIAPKGWGMPLWNLFVYAGARVGGLRERTNAFYEAGCPAFPNDYPESPLCTQESIAEASILKAKYNRTPSSKRVNYTKIGTKYPFRPPFHLLVNGDKEKPINVIHSVKIISVLVNMLQSINSDTTFDLFIAEFVALLKQLLKSRPYMSKLTNFDVKSVSLLCVRVQLMYLEGGRGESNSTIYIPDNNELTLKKTDTLDVKFSESSIMGFTTTGSYSLSTGRGSAIGVCSVKSLFQLYQQQPVTKGHPTVLVRSKNGRLSRQCQCSIIV